MATDGRTLVKRKVMHTWPDDFEEVIGMLDMIELQRGWTTELLRVQLGVLKLCEGDIDEIAGLVDLATTDFRDVLVWAEYPEQFRWSLKNRGVRNPKEHKAYRDAVARDREQYLAWLRKAGV